ncbi:MAG TPA: outer membrane protein assembly factor BamD [Pyrinomonadaceae bacterium]|nr:outer membrane protein assembly factor BamD [Pyrinomonadaceae bacterium]
MKISILCLLLLLVLFVGTPSISAQGVRSGQDPSLLRDPDLERDSQHNLEVAKNYFRLKKAYVAALKRCEEIIAGNPNFARIEEVLLMAGQSSLWLADKKGKQSPDLYVSFEGGEKRTLTSEQFREMGRGYLTKLINDYPDSPFAKQAKEELRLLEAPKQ